MYKGLAATIESKRLLPLSCQPRRLLLLLLQSLDGMRSLRRPLGYIEERRGVIPDEHSIKNP